MTPITSLREEAEPTPLMIAAGQGALWKASHREIEATTEEIVAVWRAMTGAAPVPALPSHPEYRSSGERGEADTAGVPGMVTTPSAHAAEALRLSGNAGVALPSEGRDG